MLRVKMTQGLIFESLIAEPYHSEKQSSVTRALGVETTPHGGVNVVPFCECVILKLRHRRAYAKYKVSQHPQFTPSNHQFENRFSSRYEYHFRLYFSLCSSKSPHCAKTLLQYTNPSWPVYIHRTHPKHNKHVFLQQHRYRLQECRSVYPEEPRGPVSQGESRGSTELRRQDQVLLVDHTGCGQRPLGLESNGSGREGNKNASSFN